MKLLRLQMDTNLFETTEALLMFYDITQRYCKMIFQNNFRAAKWNVFYII